MSAKHDRSGPGTPATPPPPPPPPPPPVNNRAVNAELVHVRARRPLAEEIGGNLKRFARGEQFALPADRVRALGSLVEPVS